MNILQLTMATPYSDLQVAPVQHADYSGLQIPEYGGLEHYKAAGDNLHGYDLPGRDDKELSRTPAPKRICGFAVSTFWILLVVGAIVVIGAAVGGGVGGSLASKSSKNSSSLSSIAVQSGSGTTTPAASSFSSTAVQSGSGTTTPAASSHSTGPITSSPTSTPAVTTTKLPGPTTTLLRDCPSSNNTLYSVDIGSVMTFRKICNLSYQNSLNGFAVVNSPTTSLDDCVNLCAAYNVQNQTEIAAGESDVCNAVCWRNTFVNDEFPGQCFGYTTQNSSNAFVVNQETICDAAAWINQVL